MNKKFLFYIYLIVTGILSIQQQLLFAQQPKAFAVVELFTSEGCSSCPPAEHVLMDIANENKSDVYILEFHVDYWDNLGWKDPFSNAANSERQRAYARVMELQNIYTPQAIVNGSIELVGSDKTRLQKAIADELTKSRPSNLTIITQPSDRHSLRVLYRTDGTSNDQLTIALVQTEASSDVKRGENKGSLLHHIRIVRAFKTLESPGETGSISFSIPPEIPAGNIRVFGFLQDKQNLHIREVAREDKPNMSQN